MRKDKIDPQLEEIICTFWNRYQTRIGVDKMVVQNGEIYATISDANLIDKLPEKFMGLKINYVVSHIFSAISDSGV